MAEKHKEYTPDEIAKAKLGVDMKDAVTPPEPNPAGNPLESGHPHPTQAEVAEQARREAQDRPDGRPERDDKLVNMGRGQHTTGRL